MNHQWRDIEPKMIGLWQDALCHLTDINNKSFTGKHQSCPNCSGKDRFRFDNNRHAKGDGGYLCSQCGSGTGMNLIQKLTNWSFSDAVNALGDFLGAVPAERITIAKKNIAVMPDNIYSAQMLPEDAKLLMAKCIEFPTHIYPLNEGIAPDPLMVMNKERVNGKGEKEVVDSRIMVPVIRIDEFPAQGSEPAGEIVNVAMIDHSGNVSYPCGRDELHPNGKLSFGSVSIIGRNTKKAIYLCADWADGWHVHHHTGAQVWVCHRVSNLDKVAFKFYPECSAGQLRMAVNFDFDELCEAEKNSCQVIIPISRGRIKNGGGFEKAIYDPGDLLDGMTGKK